MPAANWSVYLLCYVHYVHTPHAYQFKISINSQWNVFLRTFPDIFDAVECVCWMSDCIPFNWYIHPIGRTYDDGWWLFHAVLLSAMQVSGVCLCACVHSAVCAAIMTSRIERISHCFPSNIINHRKHHSRNTNRWHWKASDGGLHACAYECECEISTARMLYHCHPS